MLKYSLSLLVFLSLSNPSFAFSAFFNDKADAAKVKLVCVNLKIIHNTLQLYRLDNLRYPTTEEGLEKLVQKDLLKAKNVIDAWGTPYHYQSDGTDLVLSSLGKDKKTGGKELDKDITLESCLNK